MLSGNCTCGHSRAWPPDIADRVRHGVPKIIDISYNDLPDDVRALPIGAHLRLFHAALHKYASIDTSAFAVLFTTPSGRGLKVTIHALILERQSALPKAMAEETMYPYRHMPLIALQKLRYARCCFYYGSDGPIEPSAASSEQRAAAWCHTALSPKYILCADHQAWLIGATRAAAARLPKALAILCISCITPDYDRIVLIAKKKGSRRSRGGCGVTRRRGMPRLADVMV